MSTIITAADLLPEPARTAARTELWAVQKLSPAGQLATASRWRQAMKPWPSRLSG